MPISQTDIGKSWDRAVLPKAYGCWKRGTLEPHQGSETRKAMGVGRHPAVQATEKEKENRGLELQRDRQ